MNRILLVATAIGLAASPALAQNHTPPAGDIRAFFPPIDRVAPQPGEIYAPRLDQGRSAYEARRVHRDTER